MTIAEICDRQRQRLGMTSYAVRQELRELLGKQVTNSFLDKFFAGTSPVGTDYLKAIMAVLGLVLADEDGTEGIDHTATIGEVCRTRMTARNLTVSDVYRLAAVHKPAIGLTSVRRLLTGGQVLSDRAEPILKALGLRIVDGKKGK